VRLLKFLVGCAPVPLFVAIGANLLSGVSTAGMLVVVNAALTGPPGQRAFLGAAFLALVITLLATRAVSSYLAFELSHRAILELRSHLASVILQAPLMRLESVKASALLAAFTEDVNVVVSALPGIPALALNVAILGGCFAFMLWLSMFAGLLTLGALGVAGVAYYRLTHTAAGHFASAQSAFAVMFGYFRGLTEGIKELKLHRLRRMRYLSDVFLPAAGAYREFMLRANVLHYAAHILIYVLILAAMGVVLFALPASQFAHVGVGYALLLLFIGPPIETILLWVPSFSRANVSLEQMEKLNQALAAATPDDTDAVVAEPKQNWHALELRGAAFGYTHEETEREFTLGPIDLTLRPGEVVFVAGGNGSGKSTLVKVLAGLYHPSAGQMLFDGIPIDGTNREWYRQHFSVIFSDVFLFDRLLGIERSDLDTRAARYLSKLRLDGVVRVENGMLSTTSLSFGQRKRLALLIAYLDDRPIQVFDEWAAGQDPDFKATFYLELIPEMKAAGKTVVAVTHDEAYWSVADRIVRLEEGRIVSVSSGASLALSGADRP
jgi:putative ATP-binding cassette transporter